MKKQLITEISEKDFRKLKLKGYRNQRIDNPDGSHEFKMVEMDLNELLDIEIKALLQSGYESDKKALSYPVTIAIHEEPPKTYYEEQAKKFFNLALSKEETKNMALYYYSYLDKYMNMYTGAQTFQMGFGIKHLYSTRDYYEDHDDYWRVKKSETKVIYRIHLESKTLNSFILKHKSEKVFEYNPDEWIETHFDLDEVSGKWIPSHSVHVTKTLSGTTFEPTDLTL